MLYTVHIKNLQLIIIVEKIRYVFDSKLHIDSRNSFDCERVNVILEKV